ncbi:MAG: tetratricopeptide repeat protein [Thermoanaerobaculia bacterium]|nr:tetratricopeptide repeat protein [Thermoanaerobaculia bacterium]
MMRHSAVLVLTGSLLIWPAGALLAQELMQETAQESEPDSVDTTSVEPEDSESALNREQKRRLGEAIALHDQGRYDEAIAAYRLLLDEDPKNGEFWYELAFSLFSAGRNEECVEAGETSATLAKGSLAHLEAPSLAVVGNCLDHLGETRKALEVYRRALKLSPEEATLNFNYAITLANEGELDAAIAAAGQAVISKPEWPSPHFVLAQLYDRGDYRVPAFFSALRALILEPSSPRASQAVSILLQRLQAGVSRKDETNITINIDPGSSKKFGDFSTVELMMSLSAGSWTLEEDAGLTPADSVVSSVVSVVKVAGEVGSEGVEPVLVETLAVLGTLSEKELIEPLVYRSLAEFQVEGAEAWLQENPSRLMELQLWINEQ